MIKTFLLCLAALFVAGLISRIYYIKMQGEEPLSAPRSQEVADTLRISLATQRDVQLSSLLKTSANNKTYAVVWPPYQPRQFIKCDLFPSGNLEQLEISYPMQDNIFMIMSLDLNGVVDAATVYNNPLVFCDDQPSNCLPLENAQLRMKATPKGGCYIFSENKS